MTRQRGMGLVLGLAMLLPVAALAQMPYNTTAYTNRSVNMRAGPNVEFPLVTSIPAGITVQINGCVEGYAWCDVTAGPERGWVYADYLSYPYQNRPVSLYSVAPVIGFPLISFSIGPYWDTYYRHRPWYGNRTYWYGRPTNWWYRAPPPRPYQPVVRPYPYYQGGGHWNDHRAPYRNDYRPPGNNYRPPNNDYRPPNNNYRPPTAQPRPPQQQVKPRNEKPVTGEMSQTSKSMRTYSQQ